MEGQPREKLDGIDALRGFAFLLVFFRMPLLSILTWDPGESRYSF